MTHQESDPTHPQMGVNGLSFEVLGFGRQKWSRLELDTSYQNLARAQLEKLSDGSLWLGYKWARDVVWVGEDELFF